MLTSDNMQIYLSFAPNLSGDAACAVFKKALCVKELCVWLMKNMPSLMTRKTEFFIAASSHNICRLFTSPFRLATK